jgi:hypothetical protein
MNDELHQARSDLQDAVSQRDEAVELLRGLLGISDTDELYEYRGRVRGFLFRIDKDA